MDADDLAAGFGVGLDESLGAAGHLFVESSHGVVLLGLAISRLAGNLNGTLIVTANGHDQHQNGWKRSF